MELDVDILLDEGGVLVIDKPAGLAMHGGIGVEEDESLHGAIRAGGFGLEPGFDGPSFLGRLDRPTSGLVVACLSREALQQVEPAWSRGEILKDYLVLVHGSIGVEGTIDIPLAARGKRLKGSGRVEEARTSWRRLDGNARASVIVARLHTGRTHQIRRHMKAVGHPVVGDGRYGNARRDGALGLSTASEDGTELGVMLHAWKLTHDGSVPLLPAALEARCPERIGAAAKALGLVIYSS